MTGTWTAVAAGVSAVGGYLSAKEQAKAAKKAAQPKETVQYHTPYMNDYISKIAPYILSMQQKIFENRLRGYGLNPQDFSPIAAMLSGITTDYSGVGKPGASIMNTSPTEAVSHPSVYNAFGGMVSPEFKAEQQRLRQEGMANRANIRAQRMAGGSVRSDLADYLGGMNVGR